jgi:hypothetical protein
METVTFSALKFDQHKLSGERDCEIVIRWLNRKSGDEQRNAIINLIRQIQKLYDEYSAAQRNPDDFQVVQSTWEWDAIQGRTVKVVTSVPYLLSADWYRARDVINKRLSKCAGYPQLVTPTADSWILKWSGDRDADAALSYEVARLAGSGLLQRVRKCPGCTKWFYARYLHQKFCTGDCKHRHYNVSDAGKAQRRKYMREYMRRYGKKP